MTVTIFFSWRIIVIIKQIFNEQQPEDRQVSLLPHRAWLKIFSLYFRSLELNTLVNFVEMPTPGFTQTFAPGSL